MEAYVGDVGRPTFTTVGFKSESSSFLAKGVPRLRDLLRVCVKIKTLNFAESHLDPRERWARSKVVRTKGKAGIQNGIWVVGPSRDDDLQSTEWPDRLVKIMRFKPLAASPNACPVMIH